ncbi:hypothetical protein FOMPIDRAFT_1128100 [Fomitopsis schrenkii]|uniref:Fungal-type protein kinase domain-containing protein n=1 Tax=Fomitopsis schrenkii TaxID=2126942 RepID=S8FH17_FOMSC|nr:hypothetical protein FOMPIDRAFT_1128100 [Fomitopsis schrenkii]
MGASSPSEADLDSLALGEADRPPGYDVYQRKICVWLLRDKSWEATKFNDRSHMRLVMRTVGRPLSSFKSTKEMVTAIRDAIIGHKLAFLAGLIHRDLSDGNVMIHDGGVFGSFSLDLVYAFDWMEALELAGRPADKEAWAVYVEEYDQSVGAMFFMAAQILRTFVAHDIRHDLESVVWLLLYMVLRHTLQVHVTTKKELDRNQLYLERFGATGELGSFEKKMMYLHDEAEWEVKDNKPLNKLIRDLWDLAYEQNASRGKSTPLTYESVLTAFNRALAFSKWPTNDTALPFTLLCDDNSAQSS